jgi:ParB family transcriptional regulator, chromosome partitioning protein
MLNETLPLAEITRISPLNPRQDMESDVAPLAAMIAACGLIDPLVVRERPDAGAEFEVLSGGRRWRALRLLADKGLLDGGAATRIKVEVHYGADADALRIALAAAVAPRPQHPVDEYEAFAKLADLGFAVEEIARDFGESERHVRQRLALGGLAPRLRDMWRKGEIDAEAAKAWASGPLEAQEALLDKTLDKHGLGAVNMAHLVRRELRGDVMPDRSPVARFILSDAGRVAAYVAAGGRVTDDLFQPTGLRDAAIAERLANELLRGAAQHVAQAEGWALGAVEADGYDAEDDEIEINEAEEITLLALDKEIAQCSPADAAAARAQRDEILQIATLRGYPPEDRARLAIVAALDSDGSLFFSRGHEIAEQAGENGEQIADEEGGQGADAASDGAADVSGGAENDAGAERDAKEPPPPDPLARPKAKALADLIDETATKALRRIVRQRLDLALMLALVGTAGHVNGFKLAPGLLDLEPGEDCELLNSIDLINWSEDALALAADYSTNDLSVAFARRVAYAIDCRGVDYHSIDDLCAALARRGAPLKAAFAEALDACAFYEAMPKRDALKIVAALMGEGEARHAKKFDALSMGSYLAKLAGDKGFLPVPFSNWARHEGEAGNFDNRDAVDLDAKAQPPALAQAIAAAIDADEAARAEKIDKATEARPCLRAFLRDRVRFDAGGEVKAKTLYDAYADPLRAADIGPANLVKFGDVLTAIGVEKRHKSEGVHYIGLALREPQAPNADAAE